MILLRSVSSKVAPLHVLTTKYEQTEETINTRLLSNKITNGWHHAKMHSSRWRWWTMIQMKAGFPIYGFKTSLPGALLMTFLTFPRTCSTIPCEKVPSYTWAQLHCNSFYHSTYTIWVVYRWEPLISRSRSWAGKSPCLFLVEQHLQRRRTVMILNYTK